MHTMHAGTWLCCVVIVAHVVDTPTHTLATAHMLEGFRHAPQLSMHRLAHDTTPHLLRHTHAGKGSAAVCATPGWYGWHTSRRNTQLLGGTFCNSLLERYSLPSLSASQWVATTFLQQPAGKVQLAITQQRRLLLCHCIHPEGFRHTPWHLAAATSMPPAGKVQPVAPAQPRLLHFTHLHTLAHTHTTITTL